MSHSFYDLKIGAPARMRNMRAEFVVHATKYPHCPEHVKPKTWLDVRTSTLGNYAAACCALSQGFDGTGAHKTPVWYCHTGPQFRGEREACEVSDYVRRESGGGWYTNTYRDETARGIVARLTHGRFIAGYMWTSNGARVYFPDVFDDEEDAARMADEHARVFAENAMEDSEKCDAAQEMEYKIETAETRLRECIVLRHKKCMDYVRAEISEIIKSIRNMRETLQRDFADYI